MKTRELNKKFISSESCLRQVEGNLLTMIESLGLGEKQSEALKSQVRRFLWQLKRDEVA